MTAHRILVLSAELATLESSIARIQERGEKVPAYLHVIVRRRKQQLEDLMHAEQANNDEAQSVDHTRTNVRFLAVGFVLFLAFCWFTWWALFSHA